MRSLAASLINTGIAAVLASVFVQACAAGSGAIQVLRETHTPGGRQDARTEFAGVVERLRDRQEKDQLAKEAAALAEKARQNPTSAEAYYRWAVAESYLAEVLEQTGDRSGAAQAAARGIRAAERAVALSENTAEYHRILGTLCGQAVPGNLLAAMRYGRCAQQEINKALAIDPNSALVHLSKGIGEYYLPAALGGGAEKAAESFKKAIQLNPNLADAHLWLGVALRKLGRNRQARAAILKALELNPNRLWAKQQLDKTPIP